MSWAITAPETRLRSNTSASGSTRITVYRRPAHRSLRDELNGDRFALLAHCYARGPLLLCLATPRNHPRHKGARRDATAQARRPLPAHHDHPGRRRGDRPPGRAGRALRRDPVQPRLVVPVLQRPATRLPARRRLGHGHYGQARRPLMPTAPRPAGELGVERLRRSDHAAAPELATCPPLNVAWRDWLIADVDAPARRR